MSATPRSRLATEGSTPGALGSVLRHDSGSSGWIDLPRGRFELDGWEVFEGDPESPHQCRGWFRCTVDDFRAPKGTALTLQLIRQNRTARRLDVEVVRVNTTEPEWEFIAAR